MKGSPERSVAVADLVGEIGTVHGKGSGDVPDVPTGDTGGLRRQARATRRSSRRS